ncbi:MAG: alanyl-tRNA editing protein [Alphaproteobacteria bacterium]|jgi:misacylated tRNA(Ala) deacylase|nr:alanyl-tRNA editing protein [Alphaproteobacteria bacterium]
MTTVLVFQEQPYLKECRATVVSVDERGVRLDRTVFYPTGGGQPGDTGMLRWPGGETAIADTVKGDGSEDVIHVPAAGAVLPTAGTAVEAVIDWARRYRHMRMHTAMHLLCSLVEGEVTGGQVGAEKSRLDFNVPAGALDKQALAEKMNSLVAAGHKTVCVWIGDDELAARPELVRTMSVKPPTGSGRVRLMRIGPEDAPVDLQPCGGTHVADTAEIGPVEIARIENKGRQNRRISIVLAGDGAGPPV